MPARSMTSDGAHRIDRRQFLVGAAATGLAAGGASLVPVSSAQTAPSLSYGGYPQFTWSTVPTAADVGNMFRTWTANEAQFLADHLSLVSIEKGHGFRSDPNRWTEPGFLEDARKLKSFNQPTKVLFYWNALLHRTFYKASSEVKPEWVHPLPVPPTGRIQFDLGNVDCRRWWVETATEIVADGNVDGVFIDTLATARFFNPPGTPELLLDELRASLDSLDGARPLILYNLGLSTLLNDQGKLDPLLQVADGAMMEVFDPPHRDEGTSPDALKRAMLDIGVAGKAGKILLIKTWPSFSFITDFGRTAPYEEKVARARADITFPLAAFLAAAERYSYMQYSWGWNRTPVQPDNGVILYSDKESSRVDPTWYPEFLRPLGAPLGDAEVNGYVFTRSFAQAEVWVDLETHEAQIDWR